MHTLYGTKQFVYELKSTFNKYSIPLHSKSLALHYIFLSVFSCRIYQQFSVKIRDEKTALRDTDRQTEKEREKELDRENKMHIKHHLANKIYHKWDKSARFVLQIDNLT